MSKKLLISCTEAERYSYKNTYIKYFEDSTTDLYYNSDKHSCVKSFCESRGFEPDVIIVDHHFFNNMVLSGEDPNKRVRNINFNNSVLILHTHKDYMPDVPDKAKNFCNSNGIRNIFHIDCAYLEESEGFSTDPPDKLNFSEIYGGFNHHPINYCYHAGVFPPIVSCEKKYDIGFSGISKTTHRGTLDTRSELIKKVRKLCKKNKLSSNFMENRNYDTLEEYQDSMMKTRIWIDTITMGGHISARLWEIPPHNAAILTVEDEKYEGILKDGQNAIIIKKDFSDLEEKILFYLKNPKELHNIVQTAKEDIHNRHTTYNRLQEMLKLAT